MAAQTFGLPQDDEELTSPALAGQPPSVTGQAGALVPTSGPPSSGGNATEPRTPVGNGANESQGGGPDLIKDRGTPDQMMANLDPDVAVKTAEQSSKAVSGASGETGKHSDTPAKKKQANDLMKAQGADPAKSMRQLKKQQLDRLKEIRKSGDITEQHYTALKDRWKNIFNVVPKEDFGLFLMDFGMRAMMAGEEMGSIGALGAAGSGALAASQGRQQATEDRAVADEGMAQKGALEEFKAESGRIGAEASMKGAEAAASRAALAGRGYQGEKAWLLDLGRKMDKSDEEIWDMFSKVKPEAVRRQEFRDFILKAQNDASFTQVDPIIGKKYRDFDSNDITEWVEQMVRDEASSMDASDALSNALDKY